MTEGGAGKDEKEGESPRRPMNAVGLVTAEKVKQRAANAAHNAFEAWQVPPLGTRLLALIMAEDA